jgi:hypothetical protein
VSGLRLSSVTRKGQDGELAAYSPRFAAAMRRRVGSIIGRERTRERYAVDWSRVRRFAMKRPCVADGWSELMAAQLTLSVAAWACEDCRFLTGSEGGGFGSVAVYED